VSPRRKRRSVEVRNSLRLFGLLAVLAGVNVYVFFFNRGTAPREVLKPSSMIKAAEGKPGMLKQATAEANAALLPKAAVPGAAFSGSENSSKGKLPVPLASPPGGSPGQDQAALRAQARDQARDEATRPASGQADNPRENPEASPEKKFSDSETLGHVLASEGFAAEAARVVGALSRLSDPKLIRGGQSYVVRLDERGEPESFEYRPNAVTRFVVTRAESGSWIATRVDQPVETKIVAVAGTIEATLYESVQGAGEKSALAGLLVELLAWDVNFYTDSHPGDHWKVIVEKQFLGGQFYRYGHILAAEYGGRVGTFHSFYWKSARSGAEGRYFDEKGQAISKTMLKTPLRYVRISSKFDRHRFHPILHQERAHLGVDYAAPVGTPVWASSGGKVIECWMKRGSGNTVVIGHGNGMTTRYYHLSRFARGLKPGKIVRQKEVIGFVGTTGLSTGPHLHFSVTKNGAFVDPSKVQVNRNAPVVDRDAFLAAVRPRLATLRALVPGALARN
jgi:murein DD-endopeptidase MepM/ murein hydrolase activator NlpD